MIKRFVDTGFSGIINFPTFGFFDDKKWRKEREAQGTGFSREIELIQVAHDMGVFTMAYVFYPADARAMAEAGVDVMVAHVGGTAGGLVGFDSIAAPMKAAAALVQKIIRATKKVNPGIIMISASMQGQTGPHAKHRALGGQLAALSGFCHITGWPEGDPTPIGVYTDYVVPHFSVPVLLAALLYRRRTGKGQYIDLSQYESGLQFMAPILLDYTVNGREAGRIGNRCAQAAPHGAYRCRGKDRWCAVAVFTDAEWQGFRAAIGNPEWSNGPEFSTLLVRKKNEDKLDTLIGEWTIQRSAEEVMTAMQAKGVPAGVLETDQELLEQDPQLKHRQYFRQLDHPEVGKHIVHREAFTLSKSQSEMVRAPLLGEHNEYALKHILGMSDDEIAELVVAGVLE